MDITRIGRRRVCDACRLDWSATARWCGRCGQALVAAREEPAPQPRRRGPLLVAGGVALAASGMFIASALVAALDVGSVAETAVEVPLPDPNTPPTSDVVPASVLCDPPGCETWRFAAPGRLQVALSADRSTVLVTNRPSGTVYALDAATGAEHWRHEAPTNRHTQLLADTMLVWTERDLTALDIEDGEPRWSSPAPVEPHRPVYRLVRPSGHPLGTEHRVSDGWATPGPDPVAVLVGYRGTADREILLGVDLASGRALWEVDDARTTGVVGDRVVVVRDPGTSGGGDQQRRRTVAVLDARTGDELWSLPLHREGSWASPIGDRYVVVEAPGGQELLDAATGDTIVTFEVGDDQDRTTPGWWHAPPDGDVVVEVRDAPGQAAELVARHLDGDEAWRRVLPLPPGRRGLPAPGDCCVELRDGPDGALVARDGRVGPDALVITLDAATGATRRVSMRIDPAAPLDPQGSGVPGGWWVAAQGPGSVAGQHPETGETGWRLTTFGREGQLRIASADPLLVVGPGELLRLPTPDGPS